MAESISLYVRNNCGIRIKRCCASCNLKEIQSTGKRICTLTQENVNALHVCEHWEIHEGLVNAGRRKGVVRDIDTKETIIF